MLASFALLGIVTKTIEGACFGRVNAHMITKLRSLCLRRLLQQDIGFFDDGNK